MKHVISFDIEDGKSIADLLSNGLRGYATETAAHGRLVSLWLFLRSEEVLRVQSVVSNVDAWDEVGTLVFRCLSKGEVESKQVTLLPTWSEIVAIERLILEADAFCAEGGLVMQNRNGEKFFIVAGAFPHTVEIFAPFFGGDFQPEHEIQAYRREPL